MRILMVCLGNICRSPLAEGLMRSKLENKGIYNALVDSAGTGGWHEGEQPDKRSVAVAAKNGLDISTQRARKFRVSDFENFDFIFAMDSANQKDLLLLTEQPDQRARVHLFLPFSGIQTPKEVPDPWYGDESDFAAVFKLLDQACEMAVSKLLAYRP